MRACVSISLWDLDIRGRGKRTKSELNTPLSHIYLLINCTLALISQSAPMQPLANKELACADILRMLLLVYQRELRLIFTNSASETQF